MGIPKESLVILDYIGREGRISKAQALKVSGIPRPTVRLRLSQLVETRKLVARGKGRGAYSEKL